MRMRCFQKDEQGFVSITVALFLLGIVGLLAAAIDYAWASKARTQLDAQADAAALSAVGMAARGLTTAQAKAQAEQLFRGGLPGDGTLTLSDLQVSVTDVDGERNITLTYRAQYRTTFMAGFGYGDITLGKSVSAKGGTPSYVDFFLLLDNSPSMGLGATQVDIDKLKAAVGCGFACHQLDVADDNYKVAKRIGAAMRIDVVRSATQSLMDTAAAAQLVPAQFRMALYTFGALVRSERLTEIFALSSNLASAKTAANAIDLMALEFAGVKGYAHTNFEEKFNALNARIGAAGDGRTPTTPQKVVFFVSDGVADWNSVACSGLTASAWDPDLGANFSRCFEPLRLQLCDNFKQRGIKVAVLHTVYLPMPGEWAYDAFVAPFAHRVAPAMQACASEGLYFAVTPSEGIEEAMRALFLKTLHVVSLKR